MINFFMRKIKDESGMALTASTMFIFVVLSIMAFYLARFSILNSESAGNYVSSIRARNLAQSGLEVGLRSLENSYTSLLGSLSGNLNKGTFNVALDEANNENSNLLGYSHYSMLVSEAQIGGVNRSARVFISPYPDAFNLALFDGSDYQEITFPAWDKSYFQSILDTISHNHAPSTSQEVMGPSTTLNFDDLNSGWVIPTGYGGFDWYSSTANTNNSNSSPDLASYTYGNSYSGNRVCIPWFGRKENYIERQNGYFIFDNAYFGEQWGSMDNITLYGYKDGSLTGQFNFSVQRRSAEYNFIQPNLGPINKLKIVSGSNSGWWRMDDFTFRTVSTQEVPGGVLSITNNTNLNSQYPNGLYHDGDINITGCSISGTGRIFATGQISITNSTISGSIELASGGSFSISGSTLGSSPTSLSSSTVIFSNSGISLSSSTANGIIFSLGGQTNSNSSNLNGAFYTNSSNPQLTNTNIAGAFVSLTILSSNSSSNTFIKSDLPPLYNKSFGFIPMVIPGSYYEF